MIQLHFNSLDEYESFFDKKSQEVTDGIVQAIQQAFLSKKKTAKLFEIEIEGAESVFEVSLSHKEWEKALTNALEHYQEWELADHAIDTYLLKKSIIECKEK